MDNKEINRKVWILALFKFVNFLEFVLITPLSPYFTDDLGIQTSEVGWILGSYSLAAMISGITSSLFIDNYDRKNVLILCFLGLICGTILCITSDDFSSLIVSRVVSGVFGGPATAITVAILADFIPNHLRGNAMSKVMMAFPLSSIFGIPIAIEIAQLYGWQAPYFIVLLLEIICVVLMIKILPNVTDHIDELHISTKKLNRIIGLVTNKNYLTGFCVAFLTFISFFLIVPNQANLILFNFNLPPQYLSAYFFIGGAGAFLFMRLTGWICDKYNSTVGTIISSSTFIMGVLLSHIIDTSDTLSCIFALMFMMSISPRNTAISVATSKLPAPRDRAGFLSMQNASQNIASSFGGFASGALLSQGANKELVGIEYVGLLAILFSLVVPFFIHRIEIITSKNQ